MVRTCEYSKCENTFTVDTLPVRGGGHNRRFCSKKCKSKGWYESNTARAMATNKAWTSDNPDKVVMIQKRHLEKYPERRRAASERWRRNNLDKVRKLKRDWAQRNPEKIKAMRARYRANKIKSN